MPALGGGVAVLGWWGEYMPDIWPQGLTCPGYACGTVIRTHTWQLHSPRPTLPCIFKVSEWILFYVAFCTIMAISRQKEARSRDYAPLLFRMTSRVLYSAQYHRQHCSVHSMPLNSLEHCLCTATMTNIRPDRIRTWYLQVTSPSRYKWVIVIF